jgi:hypothetical protein
MMLSRHFGHKLQWICLLGIAVAFAPPVGWAQQAAFDLNALGSKGADLAQQDPMAAEMRSREPIWCIKCVADLGLQLFPAR